MTIVYLNRLIQIAVNPEFVAAGQPFPLELALQYESEHVSVNGLFGKNLILNILRQYDIRENKFECCIIDYPPLPHS